MTTDILERIASSRDYAALVEAFPPRIITGRAALKRTLAVIERLMSVEKPSVAQLEYQELLATLAEAYEAKEHYPPLVSLSSLIGHLMEAKGVSESELAVSVGVSKGTVAQWLNGDAQLTLSHLRQLAGYFGVDPSLFLEADDAGAQPPSRVRIAP